MKWLKAGNTAVVTGGAGGIGLESARRFAAAGMNVVLVDRKTDALKSAEAELSSLAGKIVSVECDVSDMAAMAALRDRVDQEFGAVHCLMNNAGIGRMGTKPWEDLDAFNSLVSVNLMGVIHGCHAFMPGMLAHGQPAAVINTGSKQGITRPPGNYAYNLSKAGVLAYTESVAHALRQEQDCQISAHLLIPAFVYTPMISAFIPQKPPFAATSEETVDFMMSSLDRGDFYILCPDNETPRPLDEKRVQWTADDIIKNRPALSRWHPDFEDAYKAFIED
ncbi:MAG: SDR family NAD(P)-dependent oxidoreductase [Henriciella sp.]|nr:SDR family NAD(P)-dependent oxidoreductase [Henriciella sp.]